MADTPHPGDAPDPERIRARRDFAQELTLLRTRAGMTVRDVARVSGIPSGTVGGYFGGRHLPPLKPADLLPRILASCGVTDPADVERWLAALRRVRRAPGRPAGGEPIPYRGLAAFQPEDTPWFHGREELTEALVGHVVTRSDGPMVVVGPSGSGKSSLLRAGLVAALTGMRAVAAQSPLLSDPWQVRVITPGEHPLRRLGQTPVDTNPLGESWAGQPSCALVVDQFEEVFTLCEDEGERRAFIAALSAAAAQDPPVRVIIGLRADFYPHFLEYPLLAEAARDRQLVVGPMTPDDLVRAIVGPAQRAGLDLEEGLVDLLLRDLAPPTHSPGGDTRWEAGCLPLLSHTLLSLWERGQGGRLTVADYRACGGVADSVARTAESTYEELGPGQRAVARHLFVRLVRVGRDSADTRRRADWADLAAMPGASGEHAASDVLGRFIERRLLTADTDHVEIAHEALLTAWPRLREWIDADRAQLLVHQGLVDAAATWDQERRDPSALYRGARLAAARCWMESQAGARATPLIHEFLRVSTWRERRSTRRLYQTVAALAVLAVATAAAGVVALQQRGQATDERNRAVSRMVATRADRLRERDPALASQLSLAAYQIAPTLEARSSLLDSTAGTPATRLLAGGGAVQSVALSPDRRVLAAGGGDKSVRLWDVANPRRPTALGAPLTGAADTVYSVAFSPDGRLLAAGGGDKSVRLWNVSDPARPTPVGPPLSGAGALVYSVAFSPDSRLLAVGSGDHTVHLWDLSDAAAPAEATAPLSGPASYVQTVAFSPDGSTLAAGSDDQRVWLWDMSVPRVPRSLGALGGPQRTVYSVAFSPDGSTLAAGSADKMVYRWDLTDRGRGPVPRPRLEGATSWINSVAFTADGQYLVAAVSDSTVRVWESGSGRVTQTLPHPGPATGVLVVPGAGTLVSGCADGTVRLWHPPGPVDTGFTATLNVLGLSPDGRLLAAGGNDTRVWTTADRRQVGPPVPSPSGAATAVAFRPDGRWLALGDRAGDLRLLRVAAGGEVESAGEPVRAHSALIELLAFSPDGRTLATASDDTTVRLWEVSDPEHPVLAATLSGFTAYVYSVAVSPSGGLLAAGSVDRTVRLWDVRNPRSPVPVGGPLVGPEHYVTSVAFSPAGGILAVGSADKTIWLWDIRDPARPRRIGKPLAGATNYVYSLAFTPDGRVLAAANTDATLWLWDVDDPGRPAPIATLSAGSGALYSVAVSPDGRMVYAGGADRTVWRWETSPDAAATAVCATAGTPLTRAEWSRHIPGVRYRSVCAGQRL